MFFGGRVHPNGGLPNRPELLELRPWSFDFQTELMRVLPQEILAPIFVFVYPPDLGYTLGRVDGTGRACLNQRPDTDVVGDDHEP